MPLIIVILILLGGCKAHRDAPRLTQTIEAYKYIGVAGWCRDGGGSVECVEPPEYSKHVLLSEDDLMAVHLYIEELNMRCLKWERN